MYKGKSFFSSQICLISFSIVRVATPISLLNWLKCHVLFFLSNGIGKKNVNELGTAAVSVTTHAGFKVAEVVQF